MKPREIGGYFELELPVHIGFLHDDGVLLNSGRCALEYVLLALGDVKRVYVPYYTCDVVMEPIEKLAVPYTFYHINQNLEIKDLPKLENDELLIYTNYFGIKDEYVKRLAGQYGNQLIVDNAQAWFSEPIKGVSTFYSPRKYVGIPDGGVAYCPKTLNVLKFEQDYSYDRCLHLLKRIDLGATSGYSDFRENSGKMVRQPVRRMSKLTMTLLSNIDFEEIKKKRIENFKHLHESLKRFNQYDIPDLTSFECPMVYPFYTNDIGLRLRLIENSVFVATYWPNVRDWCTSEEEEHKLTELLLPLPIDQRYDANDMDLIIKLIYENCNNWR